ncbi:hypothetical protein B0H14DRAFT_3880670 [Mycena olivaceomarginata]|nr:hypothetical protein B0H14DRAFT_3880670 [Mycena olivaceomarginata]
MPSNTQKRNEEPRRRSCHPISDVIATRRRTIMFSMTQESAADEPKRLREHNTQLEHAVEANGLQSHPSRSTRTSKLV